MICISKNQPFALGGRRACYRHPEDRARCIKVSLPDKQPLALRSVDPWWKRLRPVSYYDENLLDLRVYALLVKELGDRVSNHFQRIHGLVETDLGLGLDSELILDADGRVSLSSKEYIMQNGSSTKSQDAIQQLADFLVQHRILFRDPFPHNIVLQEQADGKLRAVIIDGLHRRVILPSIIRKTAEKRILRKTERLKKGLQRAEANARSGIAPKPNGMLSTR